MINFNLFFFYRRKRRPNSNLTQSFENDDDVLFPQITNNINLEDLTNAFEDNDDGFTTIKDLAERGITKMEPIGELYDSFVRKRAPVVLYQSQVIKVML